MNERSADQAAPVSFRRKAATRRAFSGCSGRHAFGRETAATRRPWRDRNQKARAQCGLPLPPKAGLNTADQLASWLRLHRAGRSREALARQQRKDKVSSRPASPVIRDINSCRSALRVPSDRSRAQDQVRASTQHHAPPLAPDKPRLGIRSSASSAC